jgi:segregation and condensation protein B
MKIDEIQSCLNEMLETEIPLADISNSLQMLLDKYASDDFSFQIYQIAEGYQFLSKPAYQASIQILLKQKSKKRLSTAALETLSIIAYKQPVTKTEIEQVRGVSCDYALQKLLDKELIVIKGKSDAVGRPLLYGTSQKFIEYFGLNSLKDLPQPKDFAASDNEIGQTGE